MAAYFEGLVIGATDQVTMGDIVGPRNLGIRLPCERIALESRQLREVAA